MNSVKAKIGIEEILETVVQKIPPPKGGPNASLQELIFDFIFA